MLQKFKENWFSNCRNLTIIVVIEDGYKQVKITEFLKFFRLGKDIDIPKNLAKSVTE